MGASAHVLRELLVLFAGLLAGSLVLGALIAAGVAESTDATMFSLLGGPLMMATTLAVAVLIHRVTDGDRWLGPWPGGSAASVWADSTRSVAASTSRRAGPITGADDKDAADAGGSFPRALGTVITHVLLAVGGSVLLGSLLRVLGAEPQEQPRIVELTRDGLVPSPEIVVLCVSAVLLAPLTEELLFRGLLFRRLWTRVGIAPAYAVVAGAFALIHLNPSGVWTYAWLSVVFAHAYVTTRRLWVAMAVHAGNNALTLCFLFLSAGAPPDAAETSTDDGARAAEATGGATTAFPLAARPPVG